MNLPRSIEGAACLRAAELSVHPTGLAVPRVDLAAALAMTSAMGVPAPIAAALLAAAAEGISAGLAIAKDRRADA